jgi:hypothetical protein
MGGVGTCIRVNIAMLYMGMPMEHYNFLIWTPPIMNSRGIPMRTEPCKSIAMQFLDACSLLMEGPSLGARRSKNSLYCPQPKRNMLQLCMPQKRLYGFVSCWVRLCLALQLQPPSIATIKPRPKLAMEDNYHTHTKHVDMHYHFIQQTVASGAIKLLYCRTEDMIADLLTKALSKNKTATFTTSLSMRHACGGVV